MKDYKTLLSKIEHIFDSLVFKYIKKFAKAKTILKRKIGGFMLLWIKTYKFTVILKL